MIRVLVEQEVDDVSGGWFWLAAPVFIAGGYTLGKDKKQAERADAAAAMQSCPKPS
jgi:hypothetical protein